MGAAAVAEGGVEAACCLLHTSFCREQLSLVVGWKWQMWVCARGASLQGMVGHL